jgi:hypothetical protein
MCLGHEFVAKLEHLQVPLVARIVLEGSPALSDDRAPGRSDESSDRHRSRPCAARLASVWCSATARRLASSGIWRAGSYGWPATASFTFRRSPVRIFPEKGEIERHNRASDDQQHDGPAAIVSQRARFLVSHIHHVRPTWQNHNSSCSDCRTLSVNAERRLRAEMDRTLTMRQGPVRRQRSFCLSL